MHTRTLVTTKDPVRTTNKNVNHLDNIATVQSRRKPRKEGHDSD